MKLTISNILLKSYGVIACITLFLGFMVSIIFGISLIIGGISGENLAIFAGNLMNWGIRLATLATLIGIIHIYLTRKHSLSFKEKEQIEPEDIHEGPSSERKETVM